MSLELPKDQLFTACVAVLQEARRPLHQKQLTLRAFEKMQVTLPPPLFKYALAKNTENVRERFLKDRWHNLPFYIGEPFCLGALRAWFPSAQLMLVQTDEVCIPGNATAGSVGAFEAVMRREYMRDKNPSARIEARLRALANGFVLQQHVQRWFQETYPRFYCPPRNEGVWRWHDKDDFHLDTGRHKLNIDVAGPNAHGSFDHIHDKPKTDIHLLCKIKDDHCVFAGVQRGKALPAHVLPASAFSPVNFLVWLNCLYEGLDYKMLCEVAAK